MISTRQDLFGFGHSRVSRPGSPSAPTITPEERDTVTLGERQASWITDALAVTQFTGSGYLYNEAAKAALVEQQQNPPFADAPLVKLEDPFLIAPGWTTRPEKFDALVAHLLKEPANGSRAVYLKEGVAFEDKECTLATNLSPQDKVFVAVYDSVLSPPDKTAPQLDSAVERIKSVHGEKVDVLGYSLGGLAVRKMLDDKLETVDQVAFLGTAHQGTRFAALASYVVKRDIKFAMNLAGVDAGHLEALEWMLPLNPEKPESNSKLADLNANLHRQLAQTTEMLSIGSDGFSTITRPWGGTEGGDGLVQVSSTKLEGVPQAVLSGRGNKQHGQLPNDTEAFLQLADYYNWRLS